MNIVQPALNAGRDADLLKAHWIEEAQHTKADVLEIARLTRAMSADDLAAAFDHVMAIGALVDAPFVGQVGKELETLAAVTGRLLSDEETGALRATLYSSMSGILAGVGLSHPSFTKVARAISREGAAKLGIV